MKRAEFGIGLTYTKTGVLLSSVARIHELKTIALVRAANSFSGGNWTSGTGIWKHEFREPIMESSATIVIYTTKEDEELREYGRFLKELFHQESVLLTITEARVEFLI